ncbi:hypothetical protein EFK50_04755 [Nocardioides marmoriginsengisoli]|uniref:Tyrosinase copper-binding domain-containing protein n=1 Tax=Nocardioides marmoriginsengisoli TaxID=661483 RepID=A0A3N0CP77_9ACTN|nr:tyrosinase family protein [Nocardioides marmoriginsengisoli]RNL65274.1 hypothetical protein EFK50_04755 [Nocardioides marmoriginsengisoli]
MSQRLRRLSVPLVLALVVGAFSVLAPRAADAQTPPCTLHQRPNAADLSPAQWTKFFAAVKQLQTRETGQPSTYDGLASAASTNAAAISNFPLQLPWIRAQLSDFEDRLRAIDPDVVLPYWDFGADSAAPETSSVWDADRFGGNGDPLDDMVVQDGAFANWRPFYPTEHGLTRAWDDGDVLTPFASTADLAAGLAASGTYSALRAFLVPKYGQVRAGIGGDLATATGPNDPLYWLIAANLDRLWAAWQKTHAGAYDGTNSGGSAAALTDPVPGFAGVEVADVMDIGGLCYTYDPFVTSVTIVGPTSPPAGESIHFQVAATYNHGDAADVSADATLTVAPASAGTCATPVGTTCVFTKAGPAQVTATYEGKSDVWPITVQAAAATAVTPVSGGLQQAFPGATYPQPLVAKVVDAYGNAVSDRPVTFTAPAGASFEGGAKTFTSGSHEDGTVTSPRVVAGSAPGLVTITARISGVLDPAAFVLVVKAQADLAAGLAAPARARRGHPIWVRVTLVNRGPSASAGAARLAIPRAWRVRRAAGGTRAGNVLVLPSASLQPGQRKTFTLRLVPRRGLGAKQLRVVVRPTTADPIPANNTATRKVRVRR